MTLYWPREPEKSARKWPLSLGFEKVTLSDVSKTTVAFGGIPHER